MNTDQLVYVQNAGKVWHVAQLIKGNRSSRYTLCGYESRVDTVSGWNYVEKRKQEPVCLRCTAALRKKGVMPNARANRKG